AALGGEDPAPGARRTGAAPAGGRVRGRSGGDAVKDTTVAARYAHALFLTTERRGETARALLDLKNVLAVVGPGTRVAGFLASPEVRVPDKRRVIQAGLEGRVLNLVLVFMDLLLRKKRLREFPAAAGGGRFPPEIGALSP